MKRRLITWLGILVSAVVLGWIVTKFDLRAAWEATKDAHLGWIALATLTYTSTFLVRGIRWAILMRPVTPVRTRDATEVLLIGFMANNILPARLGDVARAYVLAKRLEVPWSATFSNVMLERIFDGLTVIGFLAIVLRFAPPPAEWVQSVSGLMATAFILAATFAFLVAVFEDPLLRGLRTFFRWAPEGLLARVLALVERMALGFRALRSARATLAVLVLSLVIWGAEVVVYYEVARAFDLSLSPWALTLVMSVLTLGLTAPSAPGFVGVFEGLVIAGLAVYGITDASAPAFAIVLHLIHYIPGTLLGLAAAFSSGLRLRELRDSLQEDSAAAV